MNETNILQSIRMLASKHGVTLWRNNTGKLQDKNGRWVTFGLCDGSSDLIGIYKGRFVAIEVKTDTGRVRPDQQGFIDFINKNGGIAGVARSEEDFLKLMLL